MTKEELEKEIRKYLKKNYHHEYYNDVVMVMGFAEPREKRIEELEDKLEQTEKDLADYQFNYPTIKELQEENAQWKQRNETLKDALEHARKVYGDELEKAYKENAELKLKLEALEGQTPWKDIKDKSEITGQLTKAKEIIKTILGFMQTFGYSPSMDKFIAEAEQFIKDSEVEK